MWFFYLHTWVALSTILENLNACRWGSKDWQNFTFGTFSSVVFVFSSSWDISCTFFIQGIDVKGLYSNYCKFFKFSLHFIGNCFRKLKQRAFKCGDFHLSLKQPWCVPTSLARCKIYFLVCRKPRINYSRHKTPSIRFTE